jgi:ABC-type bacteriocin/lantibiotic exporter with double-glycine peptidase domain
MNSQFLQVVRHLRWYGWEEAWLNKVMASRRHELNVRIISMLLNIATYIITVCSGSFLPVVAFFAYTTLAKQKLRIDLIFPALQLLGNLQSWLRDIPNIITTLINAYVSMGRIEDFLKEPEKEEAESIKDIAPVHQEESLTFSDCSFAWPGTTKAILEKVDLTVNTGLTVLYGKIGGGKTALLQAMLGEMDKISGKYEVPNEMMGYYSQTPWLQSVSIRDNILFFSAFDEERYGLVLDACALNPDLASFKDGDLSHIGEK